MIKVFFFFKNDKKSLTCARHNQEYIATIWKEVSNTLKVAISYCLLFQDKFTCSYTCI